MRLANKKAMRDDIINELTDIFGSSWYYAAPESDRKEAEKVILEIISDYTEADNS